MLDEATKDFEKNFKAVLMGPAAATFKHDGDKMDYVVVCGGDEPIPEGSVLPVYDTPEDAVKSWRKAVRRYEGEEFLYWRIKPEIEQDSHKTTWLTGKPETNPTYGKWKIYSRFRAVS